jgi:LL-diaminopimelate aminotransferase
VISLGIGDPDTPTPSLVVEEMQRQVARPDTHQYPSNRGRESFRQAVAGFYETRFGVTLDPATEVIPAMGAKEAVANVNLAFLDPGDVALASDPGYPVYTTGPLLAGAEPVPMPLLPERGFEPDFDAIPAEVARRARLMFLNYPNNPTGGVVDDDLFARAVEFARRHDVIVVHDNAYSEITYDGYRAPSFLETPGAMDVGV